MLTIDSFALRRLGDRGKNLNHDFLRISFGHPSQQLPNFKPGKGKVLDSLMVTLIPHPRRSFLDHQLDSGWCSWSNVCIKDLFASHLRICWGLRWPATSSLPHPASLTLPDLAPSCCTKVGALPPPPFAALCDSVEAGDHFPHSTHTHIPMASSLTSWHPTDTHRPLPRE